MRFRFVAGCCLGAAMWTMPMVRAADETGCQPIREAAQAFAGVSAMHETVNVPASGKRPAMTLEMIRMGDSLYQGLGGHWHKLPVSMAKMNEMIAKGELSRCKAEGSETVSGTPTHLYSFSSAAEGGGTTAKIWIGDGNKLPVKFEGPRGISMTVRYDHVEAPAGVE